MASNIDPTKPVDGLPSAKADLRDNLQAAKDEIEALQPEEAVVPGAFTVLVGDIGKMKRYTGTGDEWTLNALPAVGEVAVENDGSGSITFAGTATLSGATAIGAGKSGVLRFFDGGTKVKVLAEA